MCGRTTRESSVIISWWSSLFRQLGGSTTARAVLGGCGLLLRISLSALLNGKTGPKRPLQPGKPGRRSFSREGSTRLSCPAPLVMDLDRRTPGPNSGTGGALGRR
eukprot:8940502-Alexandrium_andersonii.AAC.1